VRNRGVVHLAVGTQNAVYAFLELLKQWWE
jgi:hypothetical protein